MNPQRTAHGLGVEPVAADWPALHEELCCQVQKKQLTGKSGHEL